MRTGSGIVTNRRFPKGEGVSIYGKTTGMAGIGEPGTFVRLNILDERGQTVVYKETLTNIWGDYDFWFRTPYHNAKLIVMLYATYSITGSDETVIPIAVGSINPSSLPLPQSEMSWLSILPLLILGIGTVYVIKVLK